MDQALSPATLLVSIIFGMLSSYMAHSRKKNAYLWFFIGFIFGIFGFFALFLSPKQKIIKKIPTPPVPVLEGPVDKFWFYLNHSREQIGPVSYNAISKAIESGQLSKTTYVWHENLTEWKKLEELYRIKF